MGAESLSREIVLDASVALALVLRDSEAWPPQYIENLLLGVSAAWVPAIFGSELANGLILAVRRRRIGAEVAQILEDAQRLPVSVEPVSPAIALIFSLAQRHRLTAYDATYLELAQRRGVPLATLDQALRSAARAAGIALIE